MPKKPFKKKTKKVSMPPASSSSSSVPLQASSTHNSAECQVVSCRACPPTSQLKRSGRDIPHATSSSAAKPPCDEPKQSSATNKKLSLGLLDSSLSPKMAQQMRQQVVAERVAEQDVLVQEAMAVCETDQERVVSLQRICRQKIREAVRFKVEMDTWSGRHALAQQTTDKSRKEAQNALQRADKLAKLCKIFEQKNKQLVTQLQAVTEQNTELHSTMKNKFQTALNDMSEKFDALDKSRQDSAETNARLQAQNEKLAQLDKVRAEHHEHEVRTLTLQGQLSEAKLKQQEEVNSLLMKKANALQQKCDRYEKTESLLKKQLKQYSDKFNELQGTLVDSNELFKKLREESKRLREEVAAVKSERNALLVKLKKMDTELLAAQHVADAAQRQKSQLATLCKKLDTDRTRLRAELKELKPQEEIPDDKQAGPLPAAVTEPLPDIAAALPTADAATAGHRTQDHSA